MKKYVLPIFLMTLASCSSQIHFLTDKEKGPKHDTEKAVEAVDSKLAQKEAHKAAIKLKERHELENFCLKELSKLPGKFDNNLLVKACSNVEKYDICESVQGRPIFHFEKIVKNEKRRILTLALIHGDEKTGGSVARSWMERLEELDPRSSWRIIPVANPDGTESNTRTNANGVDLNRNFPTNNWQNLAIKYWKNRTRSSKRRYPGPNASSEIETKCLMKQILEFQPDFIISIHTPLGMLDFDGPKVNFPPVDGLPWRRLGNYPGSLGRYMWRDNNVPVLTIELKGSDPIQSFKKLDNLQDVSGLVAILAQKELKKAGIKKKLIKEEKTAQKEK